MKVCCGMNRPFGECEGWCYVEMACADDEQEEVFNDSDWRWIAWQLIKAVSLIIICIFVYWKERP